MMTTLFSRSAALWLSFTLAWIMPGMCQAAPGLQQGDIAVGNDVKIHYVEAGDRNARQTILLIPGWSTSTLIWQEQIERFASKAHVVAIDPRSQGHSTITVHANTPEQRAQDIRQVMRALSLKNVVLVGWSQGVQDVASYAAAFHGEDISGYVLVDAAVGAGAVASASNAEQLQQQLERFALYEQHPREYLQGMMQAIIFSAEGRKHIDAYVAEGLRTPPDLGISMLLMDFIAVDRRPALASFNRPTLIIAAAQSDELDAMRNMSRQIKDARIETIADAGHAVFLDQPERFHDALDSFARQLQ
jgi:microsomal epoxide hydrolase